MNTTLQFAIVGTLAIVLFTLVDPFMYWMPSMVQMVALTIAAALLAIFTGLMLKENGGDEREIMHRMHAGRVGYLSGIITLTLVLLFQGFTYTIDPWIPLTLALMVLAKICSRVYANRDN